MTMRIKSVKKWIDCALCAAVCCLISPVSIPLAPVPISFSVMGVFLSGMLLGPKGGAISQLIYLLLGAVGLPVFAGFAAGFGVLIGPSGGYLLGYLPAAWLVGTLYHKFACERPKSARRTLGVVCSMLAGLMVCYLFGTAWYLVSTRAALGTALITCVAVFLPADALKIIAICLIEPAVVGRLRGEANR